MANTFNSTRQIKQEEEEEEETKKKKIPPSWGSFVARVLYLRGFNAVCLCLSVQPAGPAEIV